MHQRLHATHSPSNPMLAVLFRPEVTLCPHGGFLYPLCLHCALGDASHPGALSILSLFNAMPLSLLGPPSCRHPFPLPSHPSLLLGVPRSFSPLLGLVVAAFSSLAYLADPTARDEPHPSLLSLTTERGVLPLALSGLGAPHLSSQPAPIDGCLLCVSSIPSLSELPLATGVARRRQQGHWRGSPPSVRHRRPCDGFGSSMHQ